MSGLSSVALHRLRVRRIRRLLLALGALVVALIVVALLPQGQHGGTATVPTSDRAGQGTPTGVVQGVLRSDRSGSRVCFFLDAPQGRVLLVFPPGWSADGSLRVLDAGGQTRATTGARLAFLGSPGAIGSPPACAGSGRLWYTSDIRLPTQAG